MGKWEYDGSINKYPINEGEVWKLKNGSKIAVNDLYNGIPEFMKDADMIFVDPPWNLGNLNTFMTKADIEQKKKDFNEFLNLVFKRITEINPKTCFIEMGFQNYKICEDFLRSKYPFVNAYESTYYNKFPCYMLRGSNEAPTFDYAGIDELKITRLIMTKEDFTCVGDFCMGRGAVGHFAYLEGKKFVGAELNRKRLAVLINKINKITKEGGQWEICK